MAEDLGTRVLFSVQRALRGAITSDMRAVIAEWSTAEIRLRVYIDGKVTDILREGFDASVVTQVVADFPWFERDDPAVTLEFVEIPSPAPLSLRGVPMFLRAGERVAV